MSDLTPSQRRVAQELREAARGMRVAMDDLLVSAVDLVLLLCERVWFQADCEAVGWSGRRR